MSNDPSALQIFLTKTPVPGSPALVSVFEKLAKNLQQNKAVPEAYGAGRAVLLSVEQIKQDQTRAVQVAEGVCLAFSDISQLPQDTARLLRMAVAQTAKAAILSSDQDFKKSALALSRRITESPSV